MGAWVQKVLLELRSCLSSASPSLPGALLLGRSSALTFAAGWLHCPPLPSALPTESTWAFHSGVLCTALGRLG